MLKIASIFINCKSLIAIDVGMKRMELLESVLVPYFFERGLLK